MYYHSSLILVLLTLYCYSLPIPSTDQEEQLVFLSPTTDEQAELMEPFYTIRSNDIQSSNTLNKLHYLKMLCARYGECYEDNQQVNGNNNIKPQRATSRLYYMTPKLGKRVFSSAFAGIPKFG